MRIKTYFSGTVEAAMALASRELGSDALLLTARQAGESAKHLGAYEVVFGLPGAASEHRNLNSFLADQDFHPALVDSVLKTLQGADAADHDVWAAIRNFLRFRPWDPGEHGKFAFVGPAGGGKTTTALKMALQTSGVHLVDADTGKIGSPLRRAARLAGFDSSVAVEPTDLNSFVSGSSGPLLIDLGGGITSATQWANSLRQIPGLIVCLVLPAVSRTADLAETLERYSVFAPQRLIFTKLDETSRSGAIVSIAGLTGTPLFALGTGPGLTGGLEPASEGRILSLLFGRQAEKPLAAAAAGGVR